jgi:hypothetical protein
VSPRWALNYSSRWDPEMQPDDTPKSKGKLKQKVIEKLLWPISYVTPVENGSRPVLGCQYKDFALNIIVVGED